MKTTTDTFTKKPFRWNTTCRAQTKQGDFIVPARDTRRGESSHLHPGRVPAKLLQQLNEGKKWQHY
jgi:hypothetical protein